ncbi:MAG: hypothetical protein KGI87_04795, partial [Burkholderiales bacterium]|nr:hypothetical protein [Burkholderiales bacterium]
DAARRPVEEAGHRHRDRVPSPARQTQASTGLGRVIHAARGRFPRIGITARFGLFAAFAGGGGVGVGARRSPS